MAGYWHANYWHVNYWHAEYWAPPGDIGTAGDYWHENYWHANYWATGYWAKIETGDVNQTSAPTLSLSPLDPTVNVGLNVEANTPSLSFTAQNADANLDIDPAVTTPSLGFTPLSASVAFEGYQAGDIDVRWVPQATFEVTYGVIGTAPSLGFSTMSHSVEEGGGINVAASIPSLGFTTLPQTAQLNISVEPIPPSLGFTPLNVTAGIGVQADATLPTLGFTPIAHSVVGTPNQTEINAQVAALGFAPLNATAFGVVPDTVPERTYPIDLIVNGNATTGPTNYEICERTGFRVLPGQLVEEYDGAKVRAGSRDPVHPQRFVRAISERQEGSERPEQVDRFIGTDVPQVTAADL